MNDWTSYRLQDFIPFTGDVYFRLLERMGETFWPMQLLTLVLGVVALGLVMQGRPRSGFVLTAPVWVFVAVAFFLQRYSQLNWAGHYIGYAFLVQAVLLVVFALAGRGTDTSSNWKSVPVVAGIAIALFGLIGLPLMALLSGASWHQAQVFGVHPDPTAMTMLGLALIGFRGLAVWVVAVIPALWLLVAGLTLLALGDTGANGLFVALVVAVPGLVWRSVPRLHGGTASGKHG